MSEKIMSERSSCIRGWASADACYRTWRCFGGICLTENRGHDYQFSVQVEVDFDGHFDVDGMAIFLAGFEAPSADGFDGLFVQSHAERIDDANVDGAAIRGDDDHQGAGALV